MYTIFIIFPKLLIVQFQKKRDQLYINIHITETQAERVVTGTWRGDGVDRGQI